MILNVPFFQQQHKLSCGLAAMRMLFAYFGEQFLEKDLAKDVKMHSFGNFLTDLGILALGKKYKVTSYTFHLSLLGPQRIPFNTKITQNITNKIKIRPQDKMTFASWKEYLKMGGVLIWEPPKISRLKYWTERKIPALININTTALNRFYKHWDHGHYLVVKGIDSDNIVVLDPNLSKKKAQYKINKEILLPSWSINAKRGSGYLAIIER